MKALDVIVRIGKIHLMYHQGKHYLVIANVMYEITKEEYECIERELEL